MPIYAFACPDCKRVEDRLSRMGETGESLTCSHCGHQGLTKDKSSFLFAAHGLPNGHIAVGQHFTNQGKSGSAGSDSGDAKASSGSDSTESKGASAAD